MTPSFVTRSDVKGKAALASRSPPWYVRVKAAGTKWTQTLNKASDDALKSRFASSASSTRDGRRRRQANAATVLAAGSAFGPREGGEWRRWACEGSRSAAWHLRSASDLGRPRFASGDGGDARSRRIQSSPLVLGPGRRVLVRDRRDEEGAAPVAAASLVLAEGALVVSTRNDDRCAWSGHPGSHRAGEAHLSARADGFVPKTGVPVPPGGSPSVPSVSCAARRCG